ncbi:MAG: hypothetical protein HZA95_01310 [Candidatus Vogelbacteria bacterium]|nr:hypothetical protein [Candidatus Vogelbacteria bacterium]
MELIRKFSQINKNDAPLAGGKGASLGEMSQAGFPVPPGFVVIATTFDKFLRETDLEQEIEAILDTVNHEEVHTVEHASEKIQALISSAKMPDNIAETIMSSYQLLSRPTTKVVGRLPEGSTLGLNPRGGEDFFVAVRSSATAEDSASAAWAGQLDTYLNTTEGTLLVNVKKCWASLFTPRAIFYRFEKGLRKSKISVAVVIQKMVESDVSGIAFSVHPVTEDRNQLIIEAGFGLGEAVVSGEITPDSYVVEKEPLQIIDKNVSEQGRGLYRGQEARLLNASRSLASKGPNEWRDLGEKGKNQKLTDNQIIELSEMIIKIENHYGFPCDIEWALEGLTFYITQSRPITTLA